VGKLSFLPDGLAFKKVTREPKWETIVQSRIDGPAFRVKIAYTALQKLSDKLLEVARKNQTVENDPEKEQRVLATQGLIEPVILDWEGATLANLNALLRSESVIRPSSGNPDDMKRFIAEYVDGQKEFPFSPGLAAYLWVHSYDDAFKDKVFAVIRKWTDDIATETEQGNAA
jgi:hypothetical protein